jgi:hypothetical protein
MVFQPGQSGNLAGRPKWGPKGRQTQGVLRASDLKSSKDVNSLDIIASIAACERFAVATRLQASVNLAMWQNTKPNERIGRDLGLPVADSVQTALANIARIAAEAAADRLPANLATQLIAHQQSYVDARLGHETEARLAAIEERLAREPPRAAIIVTGGLPTPPGWENVKMPELPRAGDLLPPNGGDHDDGEGPQ